ncbi:hypothetical protein AVEN_152125-1 [Araneus ventricosus]|uniref:Uncharacterized protein n=1 Tax=Araneus ventricosus TaxID=182803 RepID=A0A4Y2IUS5_ARAVE|nr:hypothetical protein AVEN_152125-1 [Araneus ventricosus]
MFHRIREANVAAFRQGNPGTFSPGSPKCQPSVNAFGCKDVQSDPCKRSERPWFSLNNDASESGVGQLCCLDDARESFKRLHRPSSLERRGKD